MQHYIKQDLLDFATSKYNRDIVWISMAKLLDLQIPEAFNAVSTPANHIKEKYGLVAATQYIIALNSINYLFWRRTANDKIDRYTFGHSVGAIAMGEAFSHVWGDAPDARNLRHHFSGNDGLDNIFTFFPDIPLPESRLKILQSIIIGDKLEYMANNILSKINDGSFDGISNAWYLAYNFRDAYNDVFLKKAQLTMIEICSLFNLDASKMNFTVPADYQLPKVLRGMDIFEYNIVLEKTINSCKFIPAGSDTELAIRAATILACELIWKYHGVSIPKLDWWLWSQRNDFHNNYHLTLTTDY